MLSMALVRATSASSAAFNPMRLANAPLVPAVSPHFASSRSVPRPKYTPKASNTPARVESLLTPVETAEYGGSLNKLKALPGRYLIVVGHFPFLAPDQPTKLSRDYLEGKFKDEDGIIDENISDENFSILRLKQTPELYDEIKSGKHPYYKLVNSETDEKEIYYTDYARKHNQTLIDNTVKRYGLDQFRKKGFLQVIHVLDTRKEAFAHFYRRDESPDEFVDKVIQLLRGPFVYDMFGPQVNDPNLMPALIEEREKDLAAEGQRLDDMVLAEGREKFKRGLLGEDSSSDNPDGLDIMG